MKQAPVTLRSTLATLSTNQKAIYQTVREQGRASRADVVRQLSLTFPSISRMVGELLEAGYLREVNYRRGGLGKPALELEINPEHTFSLGLYLEGQRAQALLINAVGVPVVRHKLSLQTRDLRALLEEVFSSLDIPWSDLGGIGISLHGVELTADSLTRTEASLGVPLFVETVAGAGIKLERYFGVGAGLGRFLYLDASRGTLGAMLGDTVIAEADILERLLAILEGRETTGLKSLADALGVATVLLKPDALVTVGFKAAERDALTAALIGSSREGSRGRLRVFTGRDTLQEPALAAASLPLFELLSVH